jgi:hypothetical protein
VLAGESGIEDGEFQIADLRSAPTKNQFRVCGFLVRGFRGMNLPPRTRPAIPGRVRSPFCFERSPLPVPHADCCDGKSCVDIRMSSSAIARTAPPLHLCKKESEAVASRGWSSQEIIGQLKASSGFGVSGFGLWARAYVPTLLSAVHCDAILLPVRDQLLKTVVSNPL